LVYRNIMSWYEDQLKDKRWKDRRMEILVRDRGRCVKCGTPHNLQVHHRKYISGRQPWEYPDKLLVTLCRTCHERAEGIYPWPEDRQVILLESTIKELQKVMNIES